MKNHFTLNLIKKVGVKSIGCYSSTNGWNAFNEATITLAQCNAISSSIPGGSCDLNGLPYYQFQSSSSMSAEMCVSICINQYGYLYGGINAGYNQFYKLCLFIFAFHVSKFRLETSLIS